MLDRLDDNSLCHRHVTVTSPNVIPGTKTYINWLPDGRADVQHIVNIVDTVANAKKITIPADMIVRDKYEVCNIHEMYGEYTEMHVSIPLNPYKLMNMVVPKLDTFGVSISLHNNKIHISLRFRDKSDLLDADLVLRSLAYTYNTKLHTEHVVYDTNPNIDDGWLPIHDRLPDNEDMLKEILTIIHTIGGNQLSTKT